MAEAVRVPRKARAKSRPKVGVGRGRGGGRGDPQGCRSTLPGPGGPRPSGGSVTAAFRLWRFRAPWDFGRGIRLLFVTLVVFFFYLFRFVLRRREGWLLWAVFMSILFCWKLLGWGPGWARFSKKVYERLRFPEAT